MSKCQWIIISWCRFVVYICQIQSEMMSNFCPCFTWNICDYKTDNSDSDGEEQDSIGCTMYSKYNKVFLANKRKNPRFLSWKIMMMKRDSTKWLAWENWLLWICFSSCQMSMTISPKECSTRKPTIRCEFFKLFVAPTLKWWVISVRVSPEKSVITKQTTLIQTDYSSIIDLAIYHMSMATFSGLYCRWERTIFPERLYFVNVFNKYGDYKAAGRDSGEFF